MRKRLRFFSRKPKKAGFLAENLIFIILNLVVLTILILFVYSRSGGILLYEEAYAKNIALLVDASKPGTVFYLDMEQGIEKARDNGRMPEEIIVVSGNVVNVKLSEDSGYSYAFFNDVILTAKFDKRIGGNKGFIFNVENKPKPESGQQNPRGEQ